jgi:hypothetical protein
LPRSDSCTPSPRRLELLQIGARRLRIARDREVVIAENREGRLRQLCDELAEQRLAAGMCQQVAGDDHEVRSTPRCPRHRASNGAHARRGDTEMEVGEVDDPQSVELSRQSGNGKLELTEPRPGRLGESPTEQAREQGSGAAHPVGGGAGIRPSNRDRRRPGPKLAF